MDCCLFLAMVISFVMYTNFSMYHVRMKNTSKLHQGLFAGAASQSRSWWVFCALALAFLFPPVMSLSFTICTPRVLMLQGLLLFNISTEIEKESDRWKETWREQVLVHYFHFVITGGVKIEKMLNLRMRRGLGFRSKNNMSSKYDSYKSVLQKIMCSY